VTLGYICSVIVDKLAGADILKPDYPYSALSVVGTLEVRPEWSIGEFARQLAQCRQGPSHRIISRIAEHIDEDSPGKSAMQGYSCPTLCAQRLYRIQNSRDSSLNL